MTRPAGLGLLTLGAIFWSSGGLFVRLLHLDVWTMLGWRSVFGAASLLLAALIPFDGRPMRARLRLGWPALIAVPVSAASMLSYIAALKLTTVANVMTIYASVPFVAAAIAFVWSGERPSRRVLWASVVCLGGIVIIAGGATNPADMAGNALAFVMTTTFAVVLVMARRFPGMAMAPVNALAALLCAVVCFPLMRGGVPALPVLAILALFGLITSGLAYLLFLTGGRHVPSGEAGLIGLLDVVLGPLWVWLAFAEQPAETTLIGAGVVLGAVIWYLWGVWTQEKKRVLL